MNEDSKIRCSDSLLRQCQLGELEIFDVFLTICKKCNLQYFVYGGTLLGAVRHGGFIPWDDDIDVAMPLADYRRFLKVAPTLLPEDLILTPGKEYGGLEAFAKLRNRHSFFCEKTTIVSEPCGLFVDIFPYERVPRLPFPLSLFLAKWCSLSWLSARAHRVLVHRHAVGLIVSAAKSLVWMSICISLKYLHRVMAKFLPSVWRSSPEVPLFQPHIGFTNEILFPLSTVVFEGRECNAPHDVDAYLTQYYGDWRTLPPPEKRQWHASIICPTQAPDVPWALNAGIQHAD